MRETIGLVLGGLLVGLPLVFATTRLIGRFLFGLAPEDPRTIALAALVMLVAAAFAGYIPARRASSVDPMVALRSE